MSRSSGDSRPTRVVGVVKPARGTARRTSAPPAPPPDPAPAGKRPAPTGLAQGYARLVVALRWWVIGLWALGTVVAVLLPGFGPQTGSDGVNSLLSADTPAVNTELRSVGDFGFPLIGRTVLVQHDAKGLSVYAQARSATNAFAVNQGKYDVPGMIGALPLANTYGLFPGARESNTTALTFLFYDSTASLHWQTRRAQEYGERFFGPRDHVVGVTGSAPARSSQFEIIQDHLTTVEITTVLAIALIVGIAFRSVVAPLASLLATGVAYVMTLRLAALLTGLVGVSTPAELEPVVVALLLGVVTDYVVFFFSALRNDLAQGLSRHDAAVAATARFGPIVTVAGLAVAAGTAALYAAQSAFFKPLGPALAFTVLMGLLVAVTLVPALMAVLGRLAFWPTRDLRHAGDDTPDRRGRAKLWVRLSPSRHFAHSRVRAAFVLAGCIVVLVLAALPLTRLGLGISFVESLPASSPVRQAADAAQAGFSPGVLSPTVILLEGDGLGQQRPELGRLGTLLGAEPGVAGVLGPGDLPLRRELALLVNEEGDAARFLVVLDQKPLGADAISTVDDLTADLPGLVQRAGLTDLRVGVAGDTATGSFIVDQTESDLIRIAVAVLLANLLVLLLFLRAVVAALYLLMASLLSVAATLGITVLVFDHLDPGQGLTFYVPFAAAVMLLAFGSDYNIFGVGHIWDEARHLPLRRAIMRADPGTSRALVSAGFALAASFGLLAIVPVLPFHQLAFAMALGILLDIFVVRMLLMPSLLVVVGTVSAWPSNRLTRPGDPRDEPRPGVSVGVVGPRPRPAPGR